MDDIGTFQVREFPAHRNATLDALEQGRKKHHVPVLFEADVTDARERLRRPRDGGGPGLSFTAWVMHCVGRAAGEHKHVHALRAGRRLVVFDDVDISVLVERPAGRDDAPAETLPMPYVVRKANRKSVREIHDEVRAAQAAHTDPGEVQLGTRRRALVTRLFSSLPGPLRNLILWRRLAKDPFLAKRTMGTVVVTSIGGLGKGGGYGWAIPLGIHPLLVAIGSIARKPGVVGDAIAVREYLSLTVLFDHDVTDGAPVARFVRRLNELLESCAGLGGASSHPAGPADGKAHEPLEGPTRRE